MDYYLWVQHTTCSSYNECNLLAQPNILKTELGKMVVLAVIMM